MPGWCEGAAVSLNGKEMSGPENLGYVILDREWKDGDVVALHLPMPIRRVYADPRVTADVGRVALMRGPIVYCLEGADNPGGVARIQLDRSARLEVESRSDLLGGVTILKGQELTAIPYYAWDNRQTGEMLVWIAEDAALAR